MKRKREHRKTNSQLPPAKPEAWQRWSGSKPLGSVQRWLRIRSLAGSVFSGRIFRCGVHARQMVCRAQKAGLESAPMDFWSVWTALYTMMAVAAWLVWTRRFRCPPRPAGVVPHPTCLERGVDTAVFRPAPARLRLRRNRVALVGDCRDVRRLLAAQPRFRLAARPLPGVGQLCGSAELRAVAAELLSFPSPNDSPRCNFTPPRRRPRVDGPRHHHEHPRRFRNDSL